MKKKQNYQEKINLIVSTENRKKILNQSLRIHKKNIKINITVNIEKRRKKLNVSTEEMNKIALNANGDKRRQSIDSIETCKYGTNR